MDAPLFEHFFTGIFKTLGRRRRFTFYVQLDADFFPISQKLYTNFEVRPPPIRARPKYSQRQAFYAVFRLSSHFCLIEHVTLGICHSCHIRLHSKFFSGSGGYLTPFFSLTFCFLVQIHYCCFRFLLKTLMTKIKTVP